MRAHFRLRIRLLTAGVLLVALILVGRLYFVQIVHGETFSQKADRQYVQSGSLLFDRGSILFTKRDGTAVSAATLKTGFLLALNPSEIEDVEKVWSELSPLVPELEHDYFVKRASRSDDPYEEVAHHLPEDTARAIERLELPGVRVFKERWRYYPGDSLAAHTVGFTAFQGDELAGRYGLERYYEDILNRKESGLYVNFFAEIFAGISIFTSEAGQAGDIVTTIEPSVQLALERTLRELNEEWGSRQTAGIIINPKNGEIYALGVYPTFDLNTFSDVENARIFSNPLVEDVHEMGSIIKPLTMAAGLDSGAVVPETTYYDAGQIDRTGYTIYNFDKRGRGTVPMQEVLNQSLNTGAAFVAEQMGANVFRNYMNRYKIGEETGIDLPGEVPGLTKNIETLRPVELATAAFGQGIAMTPIATVRALSTLGNGGVLVTPHVIKEIQFESGLSKTVSFPGGERVLKPETSEEITRMLVAVVDDALVGGTVALPNYQIAAKTGTAQIPSPEGGYYDDRFLHTFFGYFPAYDPEFLIFFMTREPVGARYASQTLTAPFMEMTKFLINYYEVAPDR